MRSGKAEKIICIMLILMFAFSICGCNEGGVGTDMSKYPFYTRESDATYNSYVFDADINGVRAMSAEVYRPYWYGNIIYNETVMPVKDGGTGEISGRLLYTPLKILAVKNHDYTVSYVEGEDYTVAGNKIVRTENSRIKYHTAAELTGEEVPPPYRLTESIASVATDVVKMGAGVYTESDYLYGYQVSVSYMYDVNDIKEPYPLFDGGFAPKAYEKLKAGQDINMTIIGDSVAEGCSSSGYFKHTPFLPPFIGLVKAGLEELHGVKVNLFNKSKGGEASAWGANDIRISSVTETNPDIVFIHFGINDCGSGVSQNMFYDNLQKIALGIKSACPDADIVFLNAFTPEPFTYDGDLLAKYRNKTVQLCGETDGAYYLDLYALSTSVLKVKKYTDVTGNGVNHLNDYTTRLYAMGILSRLYDFCG